MSVPLKSAFIFLLWAYVTEADSPRWDFMHQDGYIVEAHHIEMPWYNRTYLRIEKFEMVKFNRTFRRVFNSSADLLKEVDKNLTVQVQFYKLSRSNQYNFFPFTATFQVCQEYERNSFGFKDILVKFTNLKPCPQKPGNLYAKNLYVDHSRLPPLIPTGDYRLDGKVYHEGNGLFNFQLFFAVISKARVQYED